MRWGKTWRLRQKVTYHNKADYSADCFAAAEVLHILFNHKNAQCRWFVHIGSPEIERYVRQVPLSGRDHRRARRGICNGNSREQLHVGTVYGHALSAIRHTPAERVDAFRLLGIDLWRNHHRHRTRPGGLYFNRTIKLTVLN